KAREARQDTRTFQHESTPTSWRRRSRGGSMGAAKNTHDRVYHLQGDYARLPREVSLRSSQTRAGKSGRSRTFNNRFPFSRQFGPPRTRSGGPAGSGRQMRMTAQTHENMGQSGIARWVDEVRALTQPDRVVYCDGSTREKDALIAEALQTGELIELNQTKLPGCYLHRSAPDDVARTEHLTFISTTRQVDAGPTNNWMAPDAARAKLTPLFAGAMRGRTMYVVPFLMGPPGSRFSKVGVEITDSKYVVLNMRIMTRVGQVAFDHLARTGEDFTRCLHSLGDLSPDRRFIVHFPETNAAWSIGSGYGGGTPRALSCPPPAA